MHVAALLLLALISARGYANAHAAEADSSVEEVYIWGQQPTSAATEQTRWQRDLQLRPSNTPSDVMRLTPGLTIGQHHGGGKRTGFYFAVSNGAVRLCPRHACLIAWMLRSRTVSTMRLRQ